MVYEFGNSQVGMANRPSSHMSWQPRSRAIPGGLVQRAPDAAPAVRLVHGQLVQTHLDAFVRMRHLDTGDRFGRDAFDMGDQHQMTRSGEKALRPLRPGLRGPRTTPGVRRRSPVLLKEAGEFRLVSARAVRRAV